MKVEGAECIALLTHSNCFFYYCFLRGDVLSSSRNVKVLSDNAVVNK